MKTQSLDTFVKLADVPVSKIIKGFFPELPLNPISCLAGFAARFTGAAHPPVWHIP